MIETLVTVQDYLEFAGIDLNVELGAMAFDEAGDSPAPRFIKGIEDWCKMYLVNNFTWNGNFESEHQIQCFKEGVMYQIQYVLRNGNITNDSGYNVANGTIIPRSQLANIGMSPNARGMFRRGGMCNLMRFS